MVQAKRIPANNLLNDYHLLSFDTVDSTNDEAKRLARGGGCHGAVIWAKQQTAGKGRLGRTWLSTEGNLYVSVLLQPEKPAESLAQLSFVAAVAVLEALQDLIPAGATLQCKWPNDILLGGKKLGGILLESFQAGASEKPWVVVGVGVNVDHFPASAHFPATCLKSSGVELVSAKIILSRFIHHFIDCYNVWNTKGFAPVRRQWQAHAWGLDTRISTQLPGASCEGVFVGIDAKGGLQLKLDSGKTHIVHAGDVFPVESESA